MNRSDTLGFLLLGAVGVFSMAALTQEEFEGYIALAWKCGLIDRDQFELLKREHKRLEGLSFRRAVEVLEDEMRFEGRL